MPLEFVTSLHPGGVDLWIEQATAGIPTDGTPRLGSLVIVDVAGAVRYYVKMAAAPTATYAQLAMLQSLTTGVLGTAQILPVTLAAGNGTTAVTLPAWANGWRIVDFWISNSSGLAGAGTVQIQRGSDNAVITDAVAPQAANVIVRAQQLTTANNLIVTSGVVNFVRAGGFTAAMGWATIIPA